MTQMLATATVCIGDCQKQCIASSRIVNRQSLPLPEIRPRHRTLSSS